MLHVHSIVVYEDFDECLKLACILNDKPSPTMGTPNFIPSSWFHYLPITTWLLLIKCFNGASVAYASVLSWIPFSGDRQEKSLNLNLSLTISKSRKELLFLLPYTPWAYLVLHDFYFFYFWLQKTLLSRFSNASPSISLIISETKLISQLCENRM